jgi:hydrogenase nickel incorporation protein HypB
MIIDLNRKMMESNDTVAAGNRQKFRQHQVKVINLLGSPGAGKTSFLEATLAALTRNYKVGVIEGDLATALDAERIAKLGVPVVQINTKGGCHLDGAMIREVLSQFDLASLELLVIENVGNLVCPSTFDLGEDHKVVVLSVAEGGDKPVKYPRTFLEASAVIINKIDLLPFTDVDLEALKNDLLSINPNLELFPVSCREKQGLTPWYEWLQAQLKLPGEEPGSHGL